MAISSVNDSTPSINPSFKMRHDFTRMEANDQLFESLLKARALTMIFACSNLGDYDEDMLQWYSSAILDAIQSAKEALDFLQAGKKGYL